MKNVLHLWRTARVRGMSNSSHLKQVNQSTALDEKQAHENFLSELTFFCQRNPKYKGLKFGLNESVFESGCLIVALATALHPFDSRITPDFIIKHARFTKSGHLIWRSIEHLIPGLIFIWRFYSSKEFLKNFWNNPYQLYLLETPGISDKNKSHWVTNFSSPVENEEFVLVGDPYFGRPKTLKLADIKGGGVLRLLV